MKSFLPKSLRVTRMTKKQILVIGLLSCLIVGLVLGYLFYKSTQKSDSVARASAEKAAQLLAKDKNKNKSEALKLLNKSVKQAENKSQMQEKKAAICLQFELYDCALESYKNLASEKSSQQAYYKKKLGDVYRYNKNTSQALATYEGIKDSCKSNGACEGISVQEIEYFITQLKQNKPIVENQ